MKTRGKILMAAGAAAVLLVAAYLLAVTLVMPDFYRRRLPEKLAPHVTGAGLFEVRLGHLEIGNIPVGQAVFKFKPGRSVPHAVTLGGIKADCRFAPDHSILINGIPVHQLFAAIRPHFNGLPLNELQITGCKLSSGPEIQLRAELYSPDWRYFDAELKSPGRDRGSPFRIRIACLEESPDTVRLSLNGNFSLPVLYKALSDFGMPPFLSSVTVSGNARLAGNAILRNNGEIVSARLNAELRNTDIAHADIRLKSDENARLSYVRQDGRTSVSASGLLVDAPLRFKLKNFDAELPEGHSDTVNFTGQAELYDGSLPGGTNLLSAKNFNHAFRGTFTPKNGLWTAWSESGKSPAEIVLKHNGRLVSLDIAGYEWSGSGRGLASGDFSLSLKSSQALVSSPTARRSFSGMALNLNANFTNGAETLELRGGFAVDQGDGDDFYLKKLEGTAALTLKQKQLQGKIECRLSEARFRDYAVNGLTLSGDIHSGTPDSEEGRYFNGAVTASELSHPLGGKPLAWKKLSVNTEILPDAAGRLRGGSVNGGAESLSWDIFTLENPQGTAKLQRGKVSASVDFGKSSAGWNAHKFFSPEGKIRIDGTCKDDLPALQGSLETVELWYLGEHLSGKLDRVKLAADVSPSEIALRLEASESNAESKNGKFRSARVSGAYSTRHSPSLQRWETDRSLSGIQFRNLEWNSEAAAALIPALQLTFDNLTIRNADFTAGPLQFQKISLQQRLPGDGQLNIGQFTSGGFPQGALKISSKLDRSAWRFKGTLPLAGLNKAVMNFTGSATWTGPVPQLTAAYRIPGFTLPDPVDPGMLNPAWKGLRLSGDGSLRGELAVTPAGIRQNVHANLKNISVFGDNWAIDSVNGELEITDFEKVLTAPHQQLTFANMIIGGCELSRGNMIFHSIAPGRFLIEHAAFDGFGGRITTANPVEIDPSSPAVKLPLYAAGINLPPLLSMLGIPDAAGPAKVSGALPVEFRDRRVAFHNAQLTGHDGSLRLRGLEKFNAGAPREALNNGSIPFIQAVLQDFVYRNLEATLNPGSVRLRGLGRPAANVPYRYDAAGQRFVRTDPIDGIGSELELDTEIRF